MLTFARFLQQGTKNQNTVDQFTIDAVPKNQTF
jgi:hypothetical protein